MVNERDGVLILSREHRRLRGARRLRRGGEPVRHRGAGRGPAPRADDAGRGADGACPQHPCAWSRRTASRSGSRAVRRHRVASSTASENQEALGAEAEPPTGTCSGRSARRRSVERLVVGGHVARDAEALFDLRRQTAGSISSSRPTAATISSTSSQTKPVTPSSMTSCTEPLRSATTGVPAAMASIITRPNGSGQRMGKTKARAPANSSRLRASVTSSEKTICSPSTSRGDALARSSRGTSPARRRP